MKLTKKAPTDFEIVVDYDGAISEVYYDGQALSDLLPTIYKVNVSVDCSDAPNYVELRCYGEAKIVYKNEGREIERN